MTVRSEETPRTGSAPEPDAGDERDLAPPAAEAPQEAEAPPAAGGASAPDPAAELAEARDKWMRAEAEIQNVRRRATREREELRREVEESWLLEAAAVLDDVERGIQAAREGGAPESWTRGFDLVRDRVRDLLQRYGVQVVDPTGQPFDPNLHDALFEVDAAPGQAAGTVTQVVTRGYARNGRALRAARVAVARAASRGDE